MREGKPHQPLPEGAYGQDLTIRMASLRQLQWWASALVVLPVFIQAPWVRVHPLSACFFTAGILGLGLYLAQRGSDEWSEGGELLVGMSASWLAGCVFWGWLRAQPVWHLPVESFALPLALLALNSRWRVSSSFYLASLLGTACTDLMMKITGVMDQWPAVVEAPLNEAPILLNTTAKQLLHPQPVVALVSAALLLGFMAQTMQTKGINVPSSAQNAWAVASSVLVTTVVIDGLFLIAALIAPSLSGLI